MITVTACRHMYPEKPGFLIDRKGGHPRYTFLHFHGSVEIRLGGETIQTLPHGVILYRPGTPQYFYSRENLLHDWFHFEASYEEIPLCAFRPDRVYYPSCHRFLTKAVAELETEFFAGHYGGQILMDGRIKELFIRLERDLTREKEPSVDHETLEKFRFLRGEMLSSPEERFSVADLAQKAGISPSRFHALYKNIFGTSPCNDLICARIRQAKNSLIAGTDRIETIAEALGYENTTHFIRQFKSRVGESPSSYRKRRREGPFPEER